MERQETRQSRLSWQLAGLRVRTSMLRLSIGIKAGFRPDQPRVPRGRPEAGQWMLVPGYAQVHRVSRRRGGGGQIRIGGRPRHACAGGPAGTILQRDVESRP